jgi:hypothetical protein
MAQETSDSNDEPNDVGTTEQKRERGVRILNLVRGYVLLVVGVLLILYAFVDGVSHAPGALTMGGALVGFNPLFRATVGQ